MDNATADACMVARTTMEASTKLRGRRRRESGASTRRSRTRSTSSTRSSSTHTLRRQRYRRRMPRSSSSALGTLRWCKSTTRLRWRSRTTFARRTLTQTATGRRRTRNRHVCNVPETPANPGPAPPHPIHLPSRHQPNPATLRRVPSCFSAPSRPVEPAARPQKSSAADTPPGGTSTIST